MKTTPTLGVKRVCGSRKSSLASISQGGAKEGLTSCFSGATYPKFLGSSLIIRKLLVILARLPTASFAWPSLSIFGDGGWVAKIDARRLRSSRWPPRPPACQRHKITLFSW